MKASRQRTRESIAKRFARKPRPRIKRTCECGEPVIPGGIACERCDFLDATSTEGAAILVVEALRDHRWLTTDDLARHCNISHRRLWRAVAWLRQRGRLVTETVETEHSNQTSGYDNSPTHAAREYHQKFRTATPATLLTMHNVYRLTDRRAA